MFVFDEDGSAVAVAVPTIPSETRVRETDGKADEDGQTKKSENERVGETHSTTRAGADERRDCSGMRAARRPRGHIPVNMIGFERTGR